MKTLSKILITALCCITLSSQSPAQVQAGQVGISASLQDLQLDFTLPIWATDRFVVAPSVGFMSSSEHATDIDLGAALRIYLSKEKLSPYLGFRGGAFILTNGSSVTDKLLGVFFGAEYFLDSQFSVGGELQLNATFSAQYSNRFGNPNGTNINNATGLYVTFYF